MASQDSYGFIVESVVRKTAKMHFVRGLSVMWQTLRKFGLQYCDLPTMLWNVAVLLRVLLLNIDSRNTTPISKIFYVIFIVIASGYFYVYLVSMVWFVFWRCSETGDVLAAFIAFSLGISSEIGTVKLISMFMYTNKIREIVDTCLACDLTIIPGSRFGNNVLCTLRLVKKRTIVFWMVIIGNGVFYAGIPLLTPGRHLMEDSFILLGLEPIFETPNYQIAYLLSLSGVIFTVYLPANITAFLIVVTGYVEAQMLALSEELCNLWTNAKNEHSITNIDPTSDVNFNRDKMIDEFITKRLKEIIQIHARNIMLLKDVEIVFRGAIAMEFSLLVVGLVSELLGGLENTYIEIPFALMQVGMDCFTGQRLIDASLEFERTVYESKWENFSASNMKIVLTMLQNSQKLMKLSAGGITTLSFSSLMMVMRSIYSAYTTLRSTVK